MDPIRQGFSDSFTRTLGNFSVLQLIAFDNTLQFTQPELRLGWSNLRESIRQCQVRS